MQAGKLSNQLFFINSRFATCISVCLTFDFFVVWRLVFNTSNQFKNTLLPHYV